MSLDTHQQSASSNGNSAGIPSVENTLYRLEEIDELLREDNSSTQNALLDFLRSEEHLEDALTEENNQLRSYCYEFVKMHELRAEDICKLYNTFNECEERLVEFETGIIQFQHQLEDTADSIAKMQQQTDEVILGVRHRKEVSDKISEVYSALQECDVYCEAIRQNEVDDAYLDNLQELGHKLSFLINNKALQHSAVDDEIRPKLITAAVKAGKKLQRYLSQRILSLANDMTHISQNQEFLEERAHFAFRFLQLYNQPVALEITRQYLRTMSEAYQRPFRAIAHTLWEVNATCVQFSQPVITVEKMYEVMCNRDAWSPSGNYVNVPQPPQLPFHPNISGHTSELRQEQFRKLPDNVPANNTSLLSLSSSLTSTSVPSSHKHHKSINNNNKKGVMHKLATLNPIPSLQSSFAQLGHGSDNNVRRASATHTNIYSSVNSGLYNMSTSNSSSGNTMLSSHSLHLLRPCTFADIVHTLLGVAVRYGSLHFDDQHLHELNASNSWVWRFTATLINVINNVVRECRFIGNFFCQDVHVEGGEDFGKAETLARAVLHTSLDIIRTTLLECVKVVHDRNSTLAALRVLEIVKQYLCTSLDPIPLLLFSETIGSVKRVLTNNLYSVLEYDELLFAEIDKLDLKPFRTTPAIHFTNCNNNNNNSATETASTNVNVTTFWSLLTRENAYLITLTPHELVCSIAQLLAELEQLNVLHLQSLTFVQESNVCFDRHVTLFVSKGVLVLLNFVHALACRHVMEQVQCIFEVVNLYVVQLIWAHTLSENSVELQNNNVKEKNEKQSEETSRNSSESMLMSDTETNLSSPASPFSENDEEDNKKNNATSNSSALRTKSDHCCNVELEEEEKKLHQNKEEQLSKLLPSSITLISPPQSKELSTKQNNDISIIREALHRNLSKIIELELAQNASINEMQKIFEEVSKNMVACTDKSSCTVLGNNTSNNTKENDLEQKESEQLEEEERRCQELEEYPYLESECNEVELTANEELDSLRYDNLYKTAEKFHSTWQNNLQHFYESMRQLFMSILNTDALSINLVWMKEMSPADKLTQLLTRFYVERLLQVNSQFTEIVQKKCKLQHKQNAYQQGTKNIRSILVSNSAIRHEAQRLCSLTRSEAFM